MTATTSARTGTGTANVERWQRRHWQPVRDMDLFEPNIVRLEPTTLYEGKPISLPNVSNAYQVFRVSDQDLISYRLYGSPVIPPPGSETADVLPLLIMYEEQPSWSSALPTARWFETEAGAFWGGWIGAGGTFLGRTESTIDLPMQGLSHRRFSVGSETQDASVNQGLATLQAANPEAVERIRKLTNLGPDWDGYGGKTPTEQAVKATVELLLKTHRLTQGSLESPFIAPLPEGGLELEWELDSGAELMLVIPPTGTNIRYLLDEPTSSGDTVESEGVVPEDATLSQLVSRLTR